MNSSSRFLNLVKKLIQKLLQEVEINEEMSKITKDLPQSLRPMFGILFDENWSTQTRSKIETKIFQIGSKILSSDSTILILEFIKSCVELSSTMATEKVNLELEFACGSIFDARDIIFYHVLEFRTSTMEF